MNNLFEADFGDLTPVPVLKRTCFVALRKGIEVLSVWPATAYVHEGKTLLQLSATPMTTNDDDNFFDTYTTLKEHPDTWVYDLQA